MRGRFSKNIEEQNFKMADVQYFLREIEKAKYFDSVLRELSDENIQDLVNQFSEELIKIEQGGNLNCWRHKVFVNGSCNEFPNETKDHLSSFKNFAGFSNHQINLMIRHLNSLTKNHLYAIQVLLPELIELLIKNVFNISYVKRPTNI